MLTLIDRTVIGAASGILGGIALILSLNFFGLFFPAAPLVILLVGKLFISANQINIFGGQAIAYIAHFTVSALLGIIFINLFRVTGKDWAITKGAIFGLAVWLFLSGGVVNMLKLAPNKPDIPVALALLISHLVFGIVTSWSVLTFIRKTKL